MRALHLAATRHAPGLARRFVGEQLTQVLSADATEVVADGELVVSELVSNAVRACRQQVTVGVQVHHRWVGLTVRDGSPGLPVLHDPAPREVGGQGLRIVAALTTEWGAHPEPGGGKTVWCHLPLPAHAADHLPCARPTPGHPAGPAAP
jgi:anti-sigma regulatory factor (Ser/Thr protein kinase)